ncbi:leiomodin-3-like [Nasonia vitripennis]|uniref:Uncharacterized protein n=1 Tax=Nasonia vitripennis TaxID=7425 RepID=A0A7M7QBN4_NASVI|nr:leiomodin-3-like [Nasonia vitripennis]
MVTVEDASMIEATVIGFDGSENLIYENIQCYKEEISEQILTEDQIENMSLSPKSRCAKNNDSPLLNMNHESESPIDDQEIEGNEQRSSEEEESDWLQNISDSEDSEDTESEDSNGGLDTSSDKDKDIKHKQQNKNPTNNRRNNTNTKYQKPILKENNGKGKIIHLL